MQETFILNILRGNPGEQYWEEFELKRSPSMNIIAALMEIQRKPINRKGKRVAPVVWESGCLEEVCGSCSMLINSRPRQACAAIINRIIEESGSNVINLAPFTKFPLVRDLIVDRSIMFERLKQVNAWVDVQENEGSGPNITQTTQEVMYSLSKCMTCGCCLEACPQVNAHSSFIGPQVVAQAHLFNIHPTGALKKKVRTKVMMEEGGIADCGNAQNCQKVCPKDVPLLDAIASVGRDATLQGFKELFTKGE